MAHHLLAAPNPSSDCVGRHSTLAYIIPTSSLCCSRHSFPLCHIVMDVDSLSPSQKDALSQLQALTNGGDAEVAIGVLASVDWDVQVCNHSLTTSITRNRLLRMALRDQSPHMLRLRGSNKPPVRGAGTLPNPK